MIDKRRKGGAYVRSYRIRLARPWLAGVNVVITTFWPRVKVRWPRSWRWRRWWGPRSWWWARGRRGRRSCWLRTAAAAMKVNHSFISGIKKELLGISTITLSNNLSLSLSSRPIRGAWIAKSLRRPSISSKSFLHWGV